MTVGRMHRKFAQRATEPRFTFPEAARLLDRPSQTVRRWCVGNRRTHGGKRRFDAPLIAIDGEVGLLPLSFLNVLELRFLINYREEASMQAIRRALDFAAHELNVQRPLLEVRFAIDGRDLFLQYAASDGDQYFVNASRGGHQISIWPDMASDFLESLEYDKEEGSAYQWWPLGKQQPVVLDTRLNAGRPATSKTGVRTGAIKARSEQGWSPEKIAYDLGASEPEIEAALKFERVA